MERKITQIVDRLGVDIVEGDLNADGHYIPLVNTIVLNKKLSGYRRTLTLLHELGHACLHHNDYKLYNVTTKMHSKMENEADKFMISEIVESRFNDSDFNLDEFNYINFLESYELDMTYEPLVKDMLEDYYYRTKFV